MMTNDNHKNINKEIKCTDKIRYAVLMKVVCCLIKVCKRKEGEDSKKKNKKQKDGYINKTIE